MKQKLVLESPTASNLVELVRLRANTEFIKRTNQGSQFELKDLLSISTLTILELIFLNSKANSILGSFLTG